MVVFVVAVAVVPVVAVVAVAVVLLVAAVTQSMILQPQFNMTSARKAEFAIRNRRFLVRIKREIGAGKSQSSPV